MIRAALAVGFVLAAAALGADGVNTAGRLADLSLWRTVPEARALGNLLATLPANVACEAVFTFPLPPGPDPETAVLRTLAGVSTMKGLEVYSESLGRMETFVLDSYRVDAVGSRRALADPDPGTWGPRTTLLLYQKEEQAGDVYSHLAIDRADGVVTVTLTNMTTLTVFGIPFVAPGKLTTVLVAAPRSDRLVVVAVTLADTARFFGLENLKRTSFTHRLEALGRWFGRNLEAGR